MKTITATELVRNFRKFLSSVEHSGQEIVIVRNKQEVARLVPGPAHQTALEAMSDLYRTLPEGAAAQWLADSRRAEQTTLDQELKDRWAT
jgi:antitoxin (DNA-binding transcriptional repressor) of toxin-antitoxin stability system